MEAQYYIKGSTCDKRYVTHVQMSHFSIYWTITVPNERSNNAGEKCINSYNNGSFCIILLIVSWHVWKSF